MELVLIFPIIVFWLGTLTLSTRNEEEWFGLV